MKEKTKHKLKVWLATIGFATICSTIAVGKTEYTRINAVSYNDNSMTITLTYNDMNNYSYPNFSNALIQENGLYFSLRYEDDLYDVEDTEIVNNHYTFRVSLYDQIISFNKSLDNKFTISLDNGITTTSFTSDVVINCNGYGSTHYEILKTAFQKDVLENANVVLTPTQLNTKTYTYLVEQLENLENNDNFNNSYVIYNNNVYEFYDYDSEEHSIRYNYNSYYIGFNYNLWKDNSFEYYDENDNELTFTSNLYIYSEWIADNIYAPLQPDNIIVSITSGLGLITSLANQFLNGFTTLFYKNNALTNFAIYSLIFLGIAISFAVIKLIYNVISKNTGV